MDDELERECPDCGEERSFWLTARTELHLGRKYKWRCGECRYGFVRIDDEVDTGASA